MSVKLHGLVAATHTPFHSDGSLNLGAVEAQAEHLLSVGVKLAFIGGTTGESQSLTVEERLELGQRWMDVARGTEMGVIVHVGSNCIADAVTLARQAQRLDASAISAIAPSYFKPRSLDLLIDCCAEVAAAAPGLPFYYYDIPPLTGVSFSMPEFLAKAPARIPTLAGIKYSNPDMMAYILCLQAEGGRWDLPFGIDEAMLSGLATGANGFVGSSYNFAAPIYNRLIAAFRANDLIAARTEQLRSALVIRTLAAHGYMGAAKAVMQMLGVAVGPARLPNGNLNAAQTAALRTELDALGFFEWVK
ncbi:MAG: dihydrodipicolinate synthase family protein [Planctomycetota bacterium]